MPVLKLKVLDAAGSTLAVSRTGEQVSLVHTAPYAPGDRVALETDTPGLYCVFQPEDSMPPALIYLPGRSLAYSIPMGEERISYSPKSFTGACHLLRARLAAPEEIAARQNLAFNPYDAHGDHGFYPHATANVETRGEAVFAARNAIDGIFANDAHGGWPYQSWGINRDPNAELRLAFGRPVLVEELRLTLRADIPHDSWWQHATVAFWDGTAEELTLQKSAEPQRFTFAPRTVEWLALKNLIKAPGESPFPALTQLEVFGQNDE